MTTATLNIISLLSEKEVGFAFASIIKNRKRDFGEGTLRVGTRVTVPGSDTIYWVLDCNADSARPLGSYPVLLMVHDPAPVLGYGATGAVVLDHDWSDLKVVE